MGISSSYIEEIRDEFDFLPTWLPNTNLSLGDLVDLQGHRVRRVGSASDLGIIWEERNFPIESILTYQTANGVQVNNEASINVNQETALAEVVTGGGGINIKFTQKNAIYVYLSGVKGRQISSIHLLEQKIMSLAKTGVWNNKFAIVNEIVQADRSIILVGSGSGSHIELEGNGTLSQTSLSILPASASLGIKSEKDIGFKLISDGEITPLIRASGVRKLPFMDPRLCEMRSTPETTLCFAEVGYDDYTLVNE